MQQPLFLMLSNGRHCFFIPFGDYSTFYIPVFLNGVKSPRPYCITTPLRRYNTTNRSNRRVELIATRKFYYYNYGTKKGLPEGNPFKFALNCNRQLLTVDEVNNICNIAINFSYKCHHRLDILSTYSCPCNIYIVSIVSCSEYAVAL